jgi:hypothetical protein
MSKETGVGFGLLWDDGNSNGNGKELSIGRSSG